ncbi:hypothetical protein ACFVIL_41925 [Streptomyces sp. NPDC127159]
MVSRVGQVPECAGDSAEELHNVIGEGVLLVLVRKVVFWATVGS